MTEQDNQNDLLIQQLVSVERVSLNLSQSVIVTTEDKLRLKLQAHLSTAEKTKDWIAPFSLLVSLSLALLSADFKDFLFSAATWKALFIIAAVLSLGWLATTLRQAFRSHSIDSLIEEIKSETKIDNGNNTTRSVDHE
jgi:phosphoglycerol transferase MdoB-like AlkP superfamily enzyme